MIVPLFQLVVVSHKRPFFLTLFASYRERRKQKRQGQFTVHFTLVFFVVVVIMRRRKALKN